jgi:Thiamine biosynthesis enzyme ThiH and related uncharacterized enzymes
MKKWQKNACDGTYKSLDVHFTNVCDNACTFCINNGSATINDGKPDWRSMVKTILERRADFEDVLILGGEPCLFLDELMLFVTEIKKQTSLRIYCTSSVPKTCFDNKDKFYALLEALDGLNISAQHYLESKADCIRQRKSQYDRQSFYAELPHKDKIRINLNLVKGFLDSKEEIIACLQHFDAMGFHEIRLTELQHAPKEYVSFEDMTGARLQNPYSGGCQTLINPLATLGVYTNAKIILKRSCFVCEPSRNANLRDFAKLAWKIITFPGRSFSGEYGILYEDGRTASNWLKGGEVND